MLDLKKQNDNNSILDIMAFAIIQTECEIFGLAQAIYRSLNNQGKHNLEITFLCSKSDNCKAFASKTRTKQYFPFAVTYAAKKKNESYTVKRN